MQGSFSRAGYDIHNCSSLYFEWFQQHTGCLLIWWAQATSLTSQEVNYLVSLSFRERFVRKSFSIQLQHNQEKLLCLWIQTLLCITVICYPVELMFQSKHCSLLRYPNKVILVVSTLLYLREGRQKRKNSHYTAACLLKQNLRGLHISAHQHFLLLALPSLLRPTHSYTSLTTSVH